MAEEIWNNIIINGKAKRLEVKNQTSEYGRMKSIEGLRPFEKRDSAGNPITPTVDDANALKREIYTAFFRKPFKNVLVLAAAGASMDTGGPSMIKLWNIAEKKYQVVDGDGAVTEDGFKTIRDAVKYNSDAPDIEALLSQIEGTCKFTGDGQIKLDGKNVSLSVIKTEIFNIIRDNCTIAKPADPGLFPHKVILEKLLQRKQTSSRIKIFTLNYDLLFEYAATDLNAIIIDGFSFTFPRTFSGRFFDYDIVQREGSKLQEEDNFIQRVLHLHKLHGSLNWERDEDTNSVIISDKPAKPLMVYPREAKYEDSYEQPFFEMMARFQKNLRLNGDTVLLCIGYSFNDKHINAAIEEALNQNPGFRLAVIDPGFDSPAASKSLQQIKKVALESERIIMIAETFGDFAKYFPEIKTYENESFNMINLGNDK